MASFPEKVDSVSSQNPLFPEKVVLCTEVSVFSDSFDKQCNVSSIGTVHFFK